MSPPRENDDPTTLQLLQQAEASRLAVEELVQRQILEAASGEREAAILVTDDSEELRTILRLNLGALGYHNVTEAVDGMAAITLLRQRRFDLMILDIDMPRMNGFEVLAVLKGDAELRHLPVLVASGLDQLESVIRCVELGAEDFLTKPINSVLLGARIAASLDRKRLRDLERLRLVELQQEKKLLEIEREKSDRLLLNILPLSIADQLKQGQRTIAKKYTSVTVLFADLVDFIHLANRIEPEELVSLLNDLFSRFDRIAEVHGLEKIKTIGDCYLVVGGLPELRHNHAEAVAEMAIEMLDALADLNRERGLNLSLRIGMNSGPVVAGVIGSKKFTYDLWGATVNLAHRMQSSGVPNRIHLPVDTALHLRHKFDFTERGTALCKGLGEIRTCLLEREISLIDQIAREGVTLNLGTIKPPP